MGLWWAFGKTFFADDVRAHRAGRAERRAGRDRERAG